MAEASSPYTRAPPPPSLHGSVRGQWEKEGGGEERRENERGQALLVRLFVCSFVERPVWPTTGIAGTLATTCAWFPWCERDYKSPANERIPFVIAIVAAPVRCRFVASRLKYRGAATVSLPFPSLPSPSIVWKLGSLRVVEVCKGTWKEIDSLKFVLIYVSGKS